jgi:hypothetical protein
VIGFGGIRRGQARRFRVTAAACVAIAVIGCTRQPIVHTATVAADPHVCHLPPLPEPAVVTGFPVGAPSDLTLAVTKSDAGELQRELAGLRAILSALTECHGRP